VQTLKQRARPYLFSNSVAPAVVGASLAVLDILQESPGLREQLERNASRFRAGMADAGFDLLPGEHAIVPVMFGDAMQASVVAQRLWDAGVYAVAFSFPVVPHGQARIRVQLSASHSDDDIDRAVKAFIAARDGS
jgi:glycine C-acetyltransferase